MLDKAKQQKKGTQKKAQESVLQKQQNESHMYAEDLAQTCTCPRLADSVCEFT